MCIWYSPEEDSIKESTKEDGFLFKDEEGEFHMWVSKDKWKLFVPVKYYYIGEL